MASASEGAVLWEPSAAFRDRSELARYLRWLAERKGLSFSDYHALWDWSVRDLEAFWASLWEFLEIRATSPYNQVLEERRMPGARWFEGARLNYADHVFRHATARFPALVARSERRPTAEISWAELAHQVGAIAGALRDMGIGAGDRVVSYMPNIPETVVAFLACASVGAIWSSCAPDMGTRAVVDRFRQIEPKVLFAIDGYTYGGKAFDRRSVVAEIVAALPTLERVVLLPYLEPDARARDFSHGVLWSHLAAQAAPLEFEPVAFDHPLWIVYSLGPPASRRRSCTVMAAS